MTQSYVIHHKKRQWKYSVKLMEGQNGMLRYTKRNRKKKVETKRQRKILTMEKKRNEINNKRENDQSRKGVHK